MIIIGIGCILTSIISGIFIFRKFNFFDVVSIWMILVLLSFTGVYFINQYVLSLNEVRIIKKLISKSELCDASMIRYLDNYIFRMKKNSWYYAFTGINSLEPIYTKIDD